MKIKEYSEHLVEKANVLSFSDPKSWPDQFSYVKSSIYKQLYQQMVDHSPNAGRAYYAVTLWRKITWQIVYLQVASVHHLNCSVNVSGLTLGYFNGNLHQISLPQEIFYGKKEEALTRAALQLSEFIKQCHLQINQTCKLSKGISDRLTADLIAKALLQVTPLSREFDLNKALSQWQNLLFANQYNHFQFEPSQLNKSPPKLQRATCCLHYKVEASAYCKTCPKLKKNRK